MSVSKPSMTGQEIMIRDGLWDCCIIGVIRASGGGKPWVSSLRPVKAADLEASLRHDLEVQGIVSAQCDFILEMEVKDGLVPVLVVCAKVDASPVGLFCFRRGAISADGRLKITVELVHWDDCRLIAGSMNIVSDYGPVLAGRERVMLQALTDIQSGLGSKLLCLWLSFGRRRRMDGGSFFAFVKGIICLGPLACGFSESSESLQVTWKNNSASDSLGLTTTDGTTAIWVLQLLVWCLHLLTGSPDLQMLVEGGVCRVVEFWQHKLVDDQQDMVLDQVKQLCSSITRVTNFGTTQGLKLHMVETLQWSCGMPYALRAALRSLTTVVSTQTAYMDKVMVSKYAANQVDHNGCFNVDLGSCPCPIAGLRVAPPSAADMGVPEHVFEMMVAIEEQVFPGLLMGTTLVVEVFLRFGLMSPTEYNRVFTETNTVAQYPNVVIPDAAFRSSTRVLTSRTVDADYYESVRVKAQDRVEFPWNASIGQGQGFLKHRRVGDVDQATVTDVCFSTLMVLLMPRLDNPMVQLLKEYWSPPATLAGQGMAYHTEQVAWLQRFEGLASVEVTQATQNYSDHE